MSEQEGDRDQVPPSWSADEQLTTNGTEHAVCVDALGKALKVRGFRLAVAESCTGGLLAATLTDQPGISAWFEGGWITYSNRSKQRDLGVPATLFAEVGAVSEEVVTAMAEGALIRAKVEYAIAISGVAGPGGGSEAKPVGTVFIGWSHQPGETPDGSRPGPLETFVARFRFPGDRLAVRKAAVDVALRGLCAHLAGEAWDKASAANWSESFWPEAGLKL